MQTMVKRSISLFLVILMITAVGLTGCSKSEPAETPPDEVVKTEPTPEELNEDEDWLPAPEELSEEEIWGAPPEEPLGIPVENPYMTYYYPQEWEGKVEEIRTEDGRSQTVTFKTEISGKEVVLFSVMVGPDEGDGFFLGWLEEGKDKINVYSTMYEQNPSDWSVEEYDEICSLQERVNDIIVQFFEDERFVPNR